MGDRHYLYLVEGETEKVLIDVLKKSGCLVAGRIEVLDVTKTIITRRKIMTFSPRTTVVLVFDTDTESDHILSENLSILSDARPRVSQIVFVPQVRSFEDELLYSCSHAKQLKDFWGVVDDFKRTFIHCKNLERDLKSKGFDLSLIWTRKASEGAFKSYNQESFKIKKKKQ
jgi:hypothetical protein